MTEIIKHNLDGGQKKMQNLLFCIQLSIFCNDIDHILQLMNYEFIDAKLSAYSAEYQSIQN